MCNAFFVPAFSARYAKLEKMWLPSPKTFKKRWNFSKHNIVHLFVDRSLTCLYHNAKQHDTVEVIRFRGIELKEERQGLQRVFCPFHDDAEL